MPWDAASFKSKHNHSLNPGEAKKAASQATAMLGSGVPEGTAIATANKHINKMRKRGTVSNRAHDRMKAKLKPSSGLDQTPDVDASSG